MTGPPRFRLSETEVAAFRHDGFVLPVARVAPGFVERLRAAARLGAATADDPPRFDAWAACARAARLAGLIAPLIGAHARLWGCDPLFIAPESDAADAAWRTEAAAWPDAPPDTVSVRVALDPVDPANGCARLLPRSHERLVRELRNARDRRRIVLAPERIDRALAVEAARAPGELTICAGGVFTCEPANRSGRPRAAVVFRYRAGAA